MDIHSSTVSRADIAKRTHILFDFDGTLADTLEGITQTACRVLREFGFSDERIGDASRLVGPPFPVAFSMIYGVSSEEAQRITDAYRKIYNTGVALQSPLYPGVPQMLATLKHQHKILGTASSKLEDLLARMLVAKDIDQYFDAIVGKPSDGCGLKSYVIQRALDRFGMTSEQAASRVVMVGDRSYDIQGAHEHGIPCVAVCFGTTTRQELIGAGADVIVDSVEELMQVLLGV